MLSPPDVAVVQRDPGLPGLRLVLDACALTEALHMALPEAGITAARATYVRYKPGTSCLVAYQLEVAGTTIHAYAKCYHPDAGAKLEKARTRQRVPGPMGPGGVILEDVAVAVYAFPNDYKLTALVHLGSEEGRRRLVSNLLPDQPELWDATLYHLHYKPERRYVAQAATPTGQHALFKFYDQNDFKAVSKSARGFESQGLLQVARYFGHSPHRRALALEWLDGDPLDEVIRAPEFDSGRICDVGAALAALHAQNPDGLAYLTRENEGAALLAAARGVATVCPHLAERVRTLALQLASELLYAPQTTCPIHGDFSSAQVLLTDSGIAILDLDAAVRGDPAADLGAFVAQLMLDALRGGFSAERAETLTGRLLTGYRLETGRELPVRIPLYIAAGLLRLAPHAFRYREPQWPQWTAAILERAEFFAACAGDVGGQQDLWGRFTGL